jgi:hypothetical protein
MERPERQVRLIVSATALLATGLFGLTWYFQGASSDLGRQTNELNRPIPELFELAVQQAEPVSTPIDPVTTW